MNTPHVHVYYYYFFLKHLQRRIIALHRRPGVSIVFTGPTFRTSDKPPPNHERRKGEGFSLSKLMGQDEILDPNTRKMLGHNVYYVFIGLYGLYVNGLSSVSPIGLYDMTNGVMGFTYGLGCVENCVFSTYKMFVVLYHSKDIWKCIEVTGLDFNVYGIYDRNIFKNVEENVPAHLARSFLLQLT